MDEDKNGCNTCKSINKYFNVGVCVDQCPHGKATHSDSICYFCNTGEYIKNFTCVAECDYGEIYDQQFVCSKCPVGKVYHLNGCKDSCPDFYGDFQQICVNCGPLIPPMKGYNNKCYGTIPYVVELASTQFNYFVSCIDFTPLKLEYDGKCLNSCPENTKSEVGGYICINWKEKGKYLLDGYVVEKCPLYHFADKDNICVSCKAQGLFNLKDECIEKCPPYYLFDENNYCYNCGISGKIYYQGKCVTQCPFFTYHDFGNNKCVSCKEQNKYWIYGQKKCVDNCPKESRMYEEENTCLLTLCRDLKMKQLNIECVFNCPTHSKFNEILNSCEPFFEVSKYYF